MLVTNAELTTAQLIHRGELPSSAVLYAASADVKSTQESSTHGHQSLAGPDDTTSVQTKDQELQLLKMAELACARDNSENKVIFAKSVRALK